MLDVDLVALDTAGELSVLVDVAAPPAAAAQHVRLVIRPADAVASFTLWNQLPVTGAGDGVIVELGDLDAGERRRILLDFEVPDGARLGLASICELELRWLDLGMTERVATLPVHVARGATGRPLPARFA